MTRAPSPPPEVSQLPTSVEPKDAPGVVAVIDLGSNSARLVVADVVPGLQPRVLAEEREPVRLGEGVFHTGVLSRPAMDRTVTALKRFAAVAKARGAQRVLARGTCALREAEDRSDFVGRLKEETGIDVVILSGADEARLIARGVLSGLPDAGGEVLMVDMGGGSVEVSRAVEGTLTDVCSLKLGAVRLSEMFLRSDPPSNAEVDLLRAHARTTIKSVVGFTAGHGARVFGSAGTMSTLHQLSVGPKGPPDVSVDALEKTVLDLAKMTMARRRQLPHLEARRADIIVAGGLALVEVFRHLGAKTVEVSRRGLKEGLLLEAAESLGMMVPSASEPERVRMDGAMAVVRHYQADEPHASQVAALACKLFEGTRELHSLPDDARSELEVAALLHDIGNFVAFEKHHKHGAYLVAHAQLPGFSDQARARVAAVVRYHRKGSPQGGHAEWDALAKADRPRVLALAALLRVADALDRSHHHVVRDLTVRVEKKDVAIVLRAGSAPDMEVWAVADKGDLFQEVFHRAIRVELEAPPAARRKKGPA